MIRISGGLLIDPASDTEQEADLLIDGDKILEIGKPGAFAAAQVSRDIDAQGKWIVPGMIDLHVHLREPGQEWKETVRSGSEAAALGGFTAICAMPNSKPTNDHQEVTQYILQRAREAAAARVLPIGAVSLGLEGKEMAPYSELQRAGCVAFSDDGEPVYNAGLMRRALEWCSMLGVPISCHEEDKTLSCGGCMNEGGLSAKLGLKGWPKVAEEVMIARDIELARTTKARVHFCHVTTARGVELIRRAKNDHIAVTGEATPHHLTLTESAVGEYNTNAKMSPPLRCEEDRIALLEGVRDGTIDAVASDHAPHDKDTKEIEFGNASFGIVGLQTNLPLLLDFVHRGLLSRKRAIALFTEGPARAFGLEYGRLRKGGTADIVIVDPHYRWHLKKEGLRSLSHNSPFLGHELVGISDTVLIGGRVVVAQHQLVSQKEHSQNRTV